MTRRRRIEAMMLEALLQPTGAVGTPLDPMENTRAFIDKYQPVIDGRPYDLSGPYRHLIDIYEDDHPKMTLLCGAQVGKSAYLMARLARQAFASYGGMLGYYFPDYHLPKAFSNHRFKPFLRSSPDLAEWLGATTQKGKGQDASLTMTLGATVIFFLSVKGTSSTEGLPMKALFFDEVRRMDPLDIQLAQQRTKAQSDPMEVKVSTAGLEKRDIHAAFMDGDQRWFHTVCRCADGVILAKHWPDCIADLSSATPQLRRKVEHAFSHAGLPYLGMTEQQRAEYLEAAYVCPRCGEIIVDPREGYWEPHRPSNYAHSYQMPQLLSATSPAGRVWKEWTQPEQPLDVGEFYRSVLGRTYLDVDRRPFEPDHLWASVNTSLVWGERMSDRRRRREMKNCAMGVDVQAGYNVVTIKRKGPNGKYRTVHWAICHGDDPFRETAKLMKRYDVRICVVDAQPALNEARRFAEAFRGRVWVAFYADEDGTKGKVPMIRWGDRARDKQQQGDSKFRYTVTMNTVTAMEWSLKRWKNRNNEMPDPRLLRQVLPVQNNRLALSPYLRVGTFTQTTLHDSVIEQYGNVVFLREVSAKHRKAGRDDIFKTVRDKLGPDDWAHSNLYADAACSRL